MECYVNPPEEFNPDCQICEAIRILQDLRNYVKDSGASYKVRQKAGLLKRSNNRINSLIELHRTKCNPHSTATT